MIDALAKKWEVRRATGRAALAHARHQGGDWPDAIDVERRSETRSESGFVDDGATSRGGSDSVPDALVNGEPSDDTESAPGWVDIDVDPWAQRRFDAVWRKHEQRLGREG
jgi:hypothetical protein